MYIKTFFGFLKRWGLYVVAVPTALLSIFYLFAFLAAFPFSLTALPSKNVKIGAVLEDHN